jgi:hypothetical protein
MKLMSQEIIVYLRLLSEEVSPKEVAQLIVVPTAKSWQKGEINPITKLAFKEYGWEIKSDLSNEEGLAEKLSDILKRIEPFKEKFGQIKQNWDIGFSCVIYYKDSFPSLFLDKMLLSQISEIGASLDIDVYNLDE